MNRNDFSVVWVGFHVEGKQAFEAVCDSGFHVSAAITLDAESAAKRSGVWGIDVFCEERGIPVYKVENINDSDTVSLLEQLNPTVLCVIGWSQILKLPVLQSSRYVIGAHASLLPLNRGSAPINWSIIKGEKVTGNTLMALSEGVDTGDILAQRSFDITPYDSCKTLYDKVAKTNVEMILEFLHNAREGNVQTVAQQIQDDEVLPRRKPEDGLINWKLDAADIYNFVRALTRPYPGAFTHYKREKIIIWKASWSLQSQSDGVPGSIKQTNFSFVGSLCSVEVNCKTGSLVIHEIELADGTLLVGKKLVDFFTDFTGFDNGNTWQFE